MYTLLMTLAVVIAVLLIIVVLLQSSKGGGLAGSFGGVGQFGTVFGTRRTADFLSKATWWLGGSLIILAVVINLFFLPGQAAQSGDSIIQGGGQQSVPTSPALPQQRSTQAPTK